MIAVDILQKTVPSRKWRYKQSCHMISTDLDELHAMAKRIGLKRAWFQDGPKPHYDLTASMRAKAVLLGAFDCDSWKEVAWAWDMCRESQETSGWKVPRTLTRR